MSESVFFFSIGAGKLRLERRFIHSFPQICELLGFHSKLQPKLLVQDAYQTTLFHNANWEDVQSLKLLSVWVIESELVEADSDPLHTNRWQLNHKEKNELRDLVDQRLERSKHARQKFISQHYKMKHPELLEISNPTKIFVPNFLKLCKGELSSSELQDPSNLTRVADTDVYSMEVFQPEYCAKFVEELEHIEEMGLPITRPNTMNNFGCILDEYGFATFFQQVLDNHLKDLANNLEMGGDIMDSVYSFVVKYALNEDLNLNYHFDDSELTMNICLGKEFTGGMLLFHGRKHIKDSFKENLTLTHNVGRGFFHYGLHLHSANSITSGTRYNLILWIRSSKYRQGRAPCPCCGKMIGACSNNNNK